MMALHTWLFFVCLVCCTWTTCRGGGGGQCVWYGECGPDPDTRKTVNCLYNGTAKPFQSAHALTLFQQYCPDLFQGADTRTCCSDEQLVRLVKNMDVPQQALGHCPSCLHNFLNIFCYMTCAPDHSRFLSVARTRPWTNPETKETETQVTEVVYAVSEQFAEGMFNSCRTVMLPSLREPAISILCGHSADQCTPQNWLDYMGNINNQQTPFQIDFHITDQPYVDARGHLMTPQNATTLPCTPTHPHGAIPCLCGQSNKTRVPFDKHFPPVYRTEQVIIRRSGQHAKIVHRDPPPATTTTLFNSIFDKDFLHQVLDLQNKIYTLPATYDDDDTIALKDICFRLNHTDCTILSILNYYQNNATTLDRVKMDAYGFFVLADYLDHFLYCVLVPESVNDTTALHLSCRGTDGGPVYPWTALTGFDGSNYQNATALVITFVVNYDSNDSAERGKVWVWEQAFSQFLKDYAHRQPNMTLTFSSRTHHRGHSAPGDILIG